MTKCLALIGKVDKVDRVPSNVKTSYTIINEYVLKLTSKQERMYLLPPSVEMKILKQAKLAVTNSSGQQTPPIKVQRL